MDNEWSNKYEKTVQQNDMEMSKISSEKSKITEKLIKQKEDAIADVKYETKNDLLSVEKHFTRLLNEHKSKGSKLKSVNEDLKQKVDKSKELLKQSSESITKKDNMIFELREVINSTNRKLKQDKDELEKEKSNLNQQKKKIMDEKLELEGKIEELQYKNSDLSKKLKLSQTFLDEKSAEYDKNIKIMAEGKRKLAKCETELESLKSSYQEEIDELKSDLEHAVEDTEEFKQLVKTKDLMLDDQNRVIKELKNEIKEKEENQREDVMKAYYEEKLNKEYQKVEELNHVNSKLKELEYENEDLTNNLNDCKNELDRVEAESENRRIIIANLHEEFNHLRDEISSQKEIIDVQNDKIEEYKVANKDI